jgi:exonuclease III
MQEVYNGSSQNKIVSSWHNMIFRDAENGNIANWQSDYFYNWYDSLPGKDKDLWHPIDRARSVAVLAENKNFWGVKIIDESVNDLEAELISSPYYIMGPDRGHLNIRQDSGLIILSRYPIIEGSAMTYSSSSGSDRLANKGAVYARIQISSSEGDYIHVFNTHIQAHDYSETRLAQISELMDFISEIIKSDKDHIRPILIAGDFNVSAEKPDNWMELADISPPKTEDPIDVEQLNKEIIEYKEFSRILNGLSYEEVNITDSWLEINPGNPGFTWIGKDWITGSNNPYGEIGNQIATGNGGPQRIDYIFYFKGTGSLYLEPKSISLVPEKPDLLYCFDKNPEDPAGRLPNGCWEISLEDDCSHKSYTVSDHLGLELNFEISKDN